MVRLGLVKRLNCADGQSQVSGRHFSELKISGSSSRRRELPMRKAESWDPQIGITRVKAPIARPNPNAVKTESKMKVKLGHAA